MTTFLANKSFQEILLQEETSSLFFYVIGISPKKRRSKVLSVKNT